jgi:hypothetical protein
VRNPISSAMLPTSLGLVLMMRCDPAGRHLKAGGQRLNAERTGKL